MMNPTIQAAFNDHLNVELTSAYAYLSMSAYCESVSLPGFAQWLRSQANEEVTHAMKFYTFITDRNGLVVLQAIEKPPAEFKSIVHVFEAALKQEQKVTALIDKLAVLATKEKDHSSEVFLQWFTMEQVEEEKMTQNVIDQLRMVADKSDALWLMDREMGKRGAVGAEAQS